MTLEQKNWAIALWFRIQEPRALSVMYFFAYLLIATAGTAAVLDPPRGIQHGLGAGLLGWWSGLLLVGGLIGAISALPGIWWLERVATALCMTAIAIYGVAVVALPIVQVGQRVISVCFVLFALLMFAVRLVKIRRYSYDPEK